MQKIVLGFVFTLIGLTLYTLIDIITASRSAENAEAQQAETVAKKETAAHEKAAKKSAPSVAQRKHRFIESILPAVLEVKAELDADYARVVRIAAEQIHTPEDEAWLQDKLQQYNVSGTPCLLRRMHTHPVSLVIAQAALETGWGTSRFYREANNVFGIWSYHSDEPRIAASQTRGEKTIYVKKYATLSDAIRGYYKMIGSGYAYAGFRQARMKTDNPFELLRHLRHYSELRDEYVARLYRVIKSNKLYRYDDPAYGPMALSAIIPEYVAMKREAAEKKREQELLALNEVKTESQEDENAPAAPCDENETAQTPAGDVPLLSSARP